MNVRGDHDEDLVDDVRLNFVRSRIWFPDVHARQLNGHVQGIAVHHAAPPAHPTDRYPGARTEQLTIYASVSDFPRGWGAVLINTNAASVDEAAGGLGEMSALALPMGAHPGGINVHNDSLVIPIEHGGRPAWFTIWDLSNDPKYPTQSGFCSLERSGRDIVGLDEAKASAAGIVECECGTVTVAVLSQNRFLRIFRRSTRDLDVVSEPASVVSGQWSPVGLPIDAAHMREWPTNDEPFYRRPVVDGFSLLAGNGRGCTCETLDAVFFSASPQSMLGSYGDQHVHRYRLDLSTGTPRLEWVDTYRLHPAAGGRADVLRPGVRWGASAFRLPESPGLNLITTERFGNEAIGGDALVDEHHSGPNNKVLHLQFATTAPLLVTDPAAARAADDTVVDRRAPDRSATNHSARDRSATNAADARPFIWPDPEPTDRGTDSSLSFRGSGPTWTALVLASAGSFLMSLSVPALIASLGFALLAALTGVVALIVGGRRFGTTSNALLSLGRVGVILMTVATAASAAGTAAAWRAENVWLTGACGAATAQLGAVLFSFLVRPRLETHAQRARGWRWLIAFSALLGSAVVAIVLDLRPDPVAADGSPAGPLQSWVTIIALPIAFVSLLAAKSASSPPQRQRRLRRAELAAAPAIGFALPILVAWVVAGFLGALVPIGMLVVTVVAALGNDFYHRVSSGLDVWQALERSAVAAVLFLISIWFLAGQTSDVGVAAFIALTAFIVGVFFVWPGELGFAAVLAIIVLVWTAGNTESGPDPAIALERSVEGARQAVSDDESVGPAVDALRGEWYVALGDSFISGEGAAQFYDETNSADGNSCHRAPTAWPALVARRQGVQLKSFACSGATVDNISQVGQHPDATPAIQPGAEPQLEALTAWLAAHPETNVTHVLVSVGGNDAGFADLITACVLPGSNCREIAEAFARRADGLAEELSDTYVSLNGAFVDAGRDVPALVVNPYLNPIAPEAAGSSTCRSFPLIGGSILEQNEIFAVDDFRSVLNGEIEEAVNTANRAPGGGAVVFNTAGASIDGDLCGDQPAMNWLTLQPPDGGLSQILPTNWLTGSLHPDERGHELIADEVMKLINVGPSAAIQPMGRAPRADQDEIYRAACGELDVSPEQCTQDGLAFALRQAALILGAGMIFALAAGASFGGIATPHRWLESLAPGSRQPDNVERVAARVAPAGRSAPAPDIDLTEVDDPLTQDVGDRRAPDRSTTDRSTTDRR